MKRCCAVLLCILSLALIGCGQEKRMLHDVGEYQKVRMVMAVNGTERGIDAMVARKFSQLVDEETNGRVHIEVYPRDQLAGGNTTKGVEMIANGSVDLAAYTSGTMAILDERLSVGTIPWSYQSCQEARKVIDETGGAYYAKLLEMQGIRYLGSTHNGFRQLTNDKRPVRNVEDMQGLKIRVLGKQGSYFLFFRALGAEPIPLSWSELPTTIRQGTTDGQENSYLTILSANLDDIQKYMTIWNYAYENYIFVANTKSLDMLEPKTQAMLQEKMTAACNWGRDYMEENEQRFLRECIANGMEVIELSPEERTKFQERTQSLIGHLKEKYGAEACEAFRIP